MCTQEPSFGDGLGFWNEISSLGYGKMILKRFSWESTNELIGREKKRNREDRERNGVERQRDWVGADDGARALRL